MADTELLQRLLLQQAAKKEATSSNLPWQRKAQAILDQLLPMQRTLALDDHKRISLLTPGRCGKTFTVRARLFRRALLQPGSLSVYIGLTRQKAEQEIWDGPSGLVALCDKLNLAEPHIKWDKQKLLFKIPALESTIMIGGADDMKTIEVYRGGPGYDEVWIDEAKSHGAKLLRTLMVEILEPRVNARNGVLGLCGTPGNVLNSLFYDITRHQSDLSIPYGEPNPVEDLRWSMHRWNLAMNTTKVPGTDKTLWDLALLVKKSHGWTDQNAEWMREYLGLWAADLTDFCYRFRAYTDEGEMFNVWKPREPTSENPFGLPTVAKLDSGSAAIKWQFVIGMDLGSSDPCAIEVFAFAEQTKTIFHVHEFYEKTLSIDKIAQELDKAVKLTQRYSDYPVAIVGDTAALGSTVLADITARNGHRIDAAKKADKFGFVSLTNDDLVDGRLKILPKSELANQMATLQWDETGKKENKNQRNDCCDASIYSRGAIIQYLARKEPTADPVSSPEAEYLRGVFAKLNTKPGLDSGQTTIYSPGSTYVPD